MRPAGWIRPLALAALALALLSPAPTARAAAVDRSSDLPSAAPPASADDPFQWGEQADRRALNGHYFLPSQVVRDPFVSTHFGSGTSFGYAKFRIQGQDADGNDVDLRLKMVAIQQALDLQVGVGHVGPAGFALRFGASGDATVGVDAQSALRAPLNVGWQFGGGIVAKAWGNRWFQMALAFDFVRRTSYLVTPLQAIQNSIDQGALTADGLLSKQTVTDLQPSLSLAVSPYRVAGLVTTLRFTGEKTDGAGWAEGIDWGLHLGLDLGAVSILPLGIEAVYQLQKDLSGAKALIHYGGGGLFYTGRTHLALGVEAVVTQSSPGPGLSQLLIVGEFRLRYYW